MILADAMTRQISDTMRPIWQVAKRATMALGVGGLAVLAGCSGMSLPNFGGPSFPAQTNQQLPTATGRTLGDGPVRVALLLPLSGDVATVGTSMANAADLAVAFIQSQSSQQLNITVVVKDTGSNAQIAAQKATEAVSEGASLILGPLKAESVQAAGGVARSAGVPLIGFSNNSGAASAGVFLLNVLPEVETKRTLSYAQAQGKQAVAAIVPATSYGQIQEGAFRQAAAELGMNVRAVYQYSDETEARNAVAQITPFLEQGAIDTLFLPDRATAPSIGVLLEQAGIDKSNLMIIGSLDWAGDETIPQTSYLAGAIYPAVDESGLAALRPQYQARFGGEPHPFSTLAYTAVLLANTSSLSMSQPPYDRTQLTRPSGFGGRDGLFRFSADGRSQYSLAIKQITIGGAQQIDGPKIP